MTSSQHIGGSSSESSGLMLPFAAAHRACMPVYLLIVAKKMTVIILTTDSMDHMEAEQNGLLLSRTPDRLPNFIRNYNHALRNQAMSKKHRLFRN